MKKYYLYTFIALAVAAVLIGSQYRAELFFSGRPSGMTMVHNKVIAGTPEAMIELLRVPSRFPDATGAHIADWQGSVIVWWRHPEKHKLMSTSFNKIPYNDMRSLKAWVKLRDKNVTKENSQILNEIEAALNAVP
jgi:hypothetical protein